MMFVSETALMTRAPAPPGPDAPLAPPAPPHPKELDRCVTGIEGLDDVLGGGLPRTCLYVVQGDPGSGKTTLALQFLLEGVRRGEAVFYVTLSETKQELLKVADSHGWSLDGIPLLELSAIEAMLRPESRTTVFHASEVELGKVSDLVMGHAKKIRPARVVFDSLSEFRLMAETPLRYRRQLLNLKHEFANLGSTLLLLDDRMEASGIRGDPHVLSLAHGVIDMEQMPADYGITRRRLRVSKMRGVSYREGFHDYSIVTGGLRVFPRLVAAEHHKAFERQPVSSGIKELDQLFGGGLDRGTTTLILGPAGTGKSSLAIQYATQMASRGEKSILFAFDEVREIMFARSKALGLDLQPHVDRGMVSVQQVDPAELSPGEFAIRIIRRVADGCKLVVVDSLNGYLNAMPGEKYLNIQLHELCAYLNQQGVITILILAQHGLVGGNESPVDLSYLADTVVTLRYFETAGNVKQALAMVKKRSGPHEKAIREFRLDRGQGIRIGKPLTDFHGILTGVPSFMGEAKDILKALDAKE